MGSGCLKPASVSEPLCISGTSANPQLSAQLAPVLRASSRAGRCSAAELDAALVALAGTEADGPEATAEWLSLWLARPAPAKARQGLVALMQRLFAHCLDSRLTAAQESVRGADGGDAAEGADFALLASRCEPALRLEHMERDGLLSACLLLSHLSQTPGVSEPASDCFVPVLDGIVQLFHRAFIGQRAASFAQQLHQLCEFETETGLPPIQEHLGLLSCRSKSLLLGLLLVPEDAPPVIVVLARDGSLTDLELQLPDVHASVLMPYFEAASGSKLIQGRRVEGGEGHGLRKEFFAAMSTDALRRWGPPTSASGSSDNIVCAGNRIRIQTVDEVTNTSLICQLLLCAQAGDRLSLIFADGMEAERVATATLAMADDDSASLVVDRPFEESHRQGLLSRCELQRPSLPLFQFHRGTGQQWFSANASLSGSGSREKELRVRYLVFGKLLALAIVNHCKLSFSLPLIFFRFLMQRESIPSLEDLKGFDTALHTSLRKCLKMKATQFKQLKEIEDLPAAMTPEEYVARQVKEILVPEAMAEIQRGFWSLVTPDLMRHISPSELRQIVCSTIPVSENLSIRQLFRVVFEDDVAGCQPLVDALWAVLDSFSSVEKARFLLFVTGVEAPPEPGIEQLTVQMPFSAFTQEEHAALLGMLPQAHTCTNTLELPNYYESLRESGRFPVMGGSPSSSAVKALHAEVKRLLRERLVTAIHETDSYELDATAGDVSTCAVTPSSAFVAAPPPPGTPPPWAMTHSHISAKRNIGMSGFSNGGSSAADMATEAPSISGLGVLHLRMDATSDSNRSWEGPQLSSRSLASIPNGTPVGASRPHSRQGALASISDAKMASHSRQGALAAVSDAKMASHSRQGALAAMSDAKMDVDALLESLEEFPSAPPSRATSAGRTQPTSAGLTRPTSAVRENRWLAASKKRQGNDVDSLLEDLDAALTTIT
eukprot:TRINITY_DN3903_c0_g1_i1.p1 TRINITY_DN3903_c0_g1~~TRINITY_DN3903_c0_g1_i1.p1  ORF type:complete len:946 (+),score=162.40 TRINITY_DN3903_c0_g1_i1:123-2960(+)